MSDVSSRQEIRAAGGVLWRREEGEAEPRVALIHRPHYDDWTLPKGKVDPGEIPPVAAVREIAEETGARAELGPFLGTVHYPAKGSSKRVDYWSAWAASAPEFVPNDEVDLLEWVSVDEANDRLSHDLDRDVLAAFRATRLDVDTLIVVRHASAGVRDNDDPAADARRPLDELGLAQAEGLAHLGGAFGVSRLHAADKLRCRQTLAALAQLLEVETVSEPSLTEEPYAENPRAALDRLRELAQTGHTTMVCSQGGVVPRLVAEWCGKAELSTQIDVVKASAWVLSVGRTPNGPRPLAAQFIASPLADESWDGDIPHFAL
ncbi:NUDIX hydrolase [Segniliparus rotundus DSM 44985]|uniref:NUDIX hydrolase n=1 Tax=Segniliparus rotundus (strain ATCC BAA-972 / CDC 1076 / CIP 108378 / DSM 44985 / JCM 13578) TaxID=640132 RepID=D6ZET5_SEGRD|nr:NUDIX hydrolase [Segniliparus rotundus DSM 44985]